MHSISLQAHQQQRLYPHTLFIVEGWYPSDWWKGNEEQQRYLRDKYDGCTVAAREAVARYVMAPHDTGRTSPNRSHVADSGLVSAKVYFAFIWHLYDCYNFLNS